MLILYLQITNNGRSSARKPVPYRGLCNLQFHNPNVHGDRVVLRVHRGQTADFIGIPDGQPQYEGSSHRVVLDRQLRIIHNDARGSCRDLRVWQHVLHDPVWFSLYSNCQHDFVRSSSSTFKVNVPLRGKKNT